MKIQAVIIKKQDTKEYDQLVTCYSQEMGKFTAVAKSSLKPNSIQGMQLDLMNLVEFELVFGQGNMPIITGAQAQNVYRGIKHTLPSLAAGYFFLEILDRAVFDHQQDAQLWDFLLTTFGELDQRGAAGVLTLNFFREKQKILLTTLGYGETTESADILLEQIAGRHLNSLGFLYSSIPGSHGILR